MEIVATICTALLFTGIASMAFGGTVFIISCAVEKFAKSKHHYEAANWYIHRWIDEYWKKRECTQKCPIKVTVRKKVSR